MTCVSDDCRTFDETLADHRLSRVLLLPPPMIQYIFISLLGGLCFGLVSVSVQQGKSGYECEYGSPFDLRKQATDRRLLVSSTRPRLMGRIRARIQRMGYRGQLVRVSPDNVDVNE